MGNYSDATISLIQSTLNAFYINPKNACLLRPYRPPILPILPYPWGTYTKPVPPKKPAKILFPIITVNQILNEISRNGLTDDNLNNYINNNSKFLDRIIAGIARTMRANLTIIDPSALPNLGW